MPLEIINVEQGSPEWFQARLGIPTASMFQTVMASGKGGGESKTRLKYMRELAYERRTGRQSESFENAHTLRGREQEPKARNLYAFAREVDPQQVGFMKNYGAGASPDSLIGENNGLEIKCCLPHIQIERLQDQRLPPEYRHQVQGCMWIADRDRWDFMSYCPDLPPLIVPVKRDDAFIRQIADAVELFNEELEDLMAKLDGMRGVIVAEAA